MRLTGRLLFLTAGLIHFSAVGAEWKPALAAKFLDQRQKEWFAWPTAKANGGPCVSCHTGVTYLMARPQLRRVLGEVAPTPYETGLMNALRARLDEKAVSPGFSKEPLASESMGVEAILAVSFLTRDSSQEKVSPEALRALDRLWLLQRTEGERKGGWSWFELNLDPYETGDSPYFGAALAAVAVASTPASYRENPEVAERIEALRGYLRSSYSIQPLQNRLALAWASAKLGGILPAESVSNIVDEALNKQRSDGAWTMESLGAWKEHPAATPHMGSSSYATAFTAYMLEQTGLPASNSSVAAALTWLGAHQDADSGAWTDRSMNKQYPAGSMQEKFMTDAATGFAVLALTNRPD